MGMILQGRRRFIVAALVAATALVLVLMGQAFASEQESAGADKAQAIAGSEPQAAADARDAEGAVLSGDLEFGAAADAYINEMEGASSANGSASLSQFLEPEAAADVPGQ
jgi:hypothetical protein